MQSSVVDPFDLTRFLEPQEADIERALEEIRAGFKATHWIWYVFPQIDGLGSSPMSKRYAIRSLKEARAYLEHPILGRRLSDCVAAMNVHSGRSAAAILGDLDAAKFRSCLTLFAAVAGENPLFELSLSTFFGGAPDSATLSILRKLEASDSA